MTEEETLRACRTSGARQQTMPGLPRRVLTTSVALPGEDLRAVPQARSTLRDKGRLLARFEAKAVINRQDKQRPAPAFGPGRGEMKQAERIAAPGYSKTDRAAGPCCHPVNQRANMIA